MRLVKSLVLLVALFPSTTFAEITVIKRRSTGQVKKYEGMTEQLDADSNQLAAALLNRRPTTGTNRQPATDGMQVALIKIKK